MKNQIVKTARKTHTMIASAIPMKVIVKYADHVMAVNFAAAVLYVRNTNTVETKQ